MIRTLEKLKLKYQKFNIISYHFHIFVVFNVQPPIIIVFLSCSYFYGFPWFSPTLLQISIKFNVDINSKCPLTHMNILNTSRPSVVQVSLFKWSQTFCLKLGGNNHIFLSACKHVSPHQQPRLNWMDSQYFLSFSLRPDGRWKEVWVLSCVFWRLRLPSNTELEAAFVCLIFYDRI